VRPSRPAAALIAGGRARRFNGRDKSRLIVGGRAIIVRQLAELRRVADEIFIVADDEMRFADLRVPVRRDDRIGVLGAIATAIATAAADRVLTIAADMPFVTADLLDAVAARALQGDGAWVVTPRGPEPLVACYRQQALPAIRGRIRDGHLKASELASCLDLRPVGLEELRAFGSPDELLTNINTADDHARVE